MERSTQRKKDSEKSSFGYSRVGDARQIIRHPDFGGWGPIWRVASYLVVMHLNLPVLVYGCTMIGIFRVANRNLLNS
jgi:hypothetical protein